MSLLAELFDRLETSTAGVDTLKTEGIRATDPAPRFQHSQNVAATTSSAGPKVEHYEKTVVNNSGGATEITETFPASTQHPTLGDVDQPQHIVNTAATASPEWRHARDQHINHLMACRACHAPVGRYCPAGAELRQRYDQTPSEPTL